MGGFTFSPCKMTVDAFDRLAQLPLAVGLHQAADGDLATRPGKRWPVANSVGMPFFLAAWARSIPVWSLRRRTSLRIRCDLLALEHLERFVEVVDRRDDLVSGVAEHIFIVERGQRLVLDDEDPLDDLLTLPEQHRTPNQ